MKTLKNRCQDRGAIFVIEKREKIPFSVERMYFFKELPDGSVRGNHAHRKSEQLHICQRGKVVVFLDDGVNKNEVTLTEGDLLRVMPMTWHTVTLYDKAVLMILASDIYDENDYIRNYDEFIRIAREGPLS